MLFQKYILGTFILQYFNFFLMGDGGYYSCLLDSFVGTLLRDILILVSGLVLI